jgi:hypothetical protein
MQARPPELLGRRKTFIAALRMGEE